MKKILHLTLKKIWFDKIASGEKTSEYREIKPYWDVRLKNKEYDEIYFKNGYAKDAPFMRVEWKGCYKNEVIMDGDEIQVPASAYIIELGKILEIKNYEPA